MGNNIILETKFVADIRGSFYIPSYQRGYRWSETEVVRLLDDIYQNGKKNYCLQPVVVRKKEDRYELIDGQQRLTTLYLIYKYMKNVNPFFNEPAFTLSYQTRDQSEEFLKTLDMTKQDDNIDFWFIAKAYNTIKKWFEQDLQIRVMHIFEYLKEDVKIIWYEVGESEDAISLFTRLNIGKIPLTSAELVKAMFLSRDNAENMRREKQEEISLQWDGIESIYRAMDTKGTGEFVPLSFSAKTGKPLNAKSTLADTAKLGRIRDHLDGLLIDMAKNLYSGRIDAEPLCTGGRSPCTYCEFRCACTHRDGEHERTINIKDDPFAE